jgi:microcystin-dependent protein
MPIPSTINDLDPVASNNSPQGSEAVGPNANGYIQALSAFIKQIYGGALKPLAALNMNGQKITNAANGTVSSTSTDLVTGAQLAAARGRVGEFRMWGGPAGQAAVTAVWGPGWFIADGTNGTIDLRDRFIVAAGLSYAFGATGGVATYSLTSAQMPVHSHAIGDPGHSHGINDGGHGHGLNDPGHAHGNIVDVTQGSSPTSRFWPQGFSNFGTVNTQNAATGMSVQAALSNISAAAALTGITGTGTAGSGAAIDNRPPFLALIFIQYTGAGV